MTVYIYDLSDPRTGFVRYIGKSVNPKERLATHIREARRGSLVHSRRWIDGLLKAGLRPVMGIVEETDKEHANDAERYWIGSLRLVGADLTNKTPGGDGQAPGYRPSTEAIAKTSAATRGRKISDERRAILREAFNRPEVRARRAEITRQRMTDPVQRAAAQRGRTGVPVSEQTKQKMSAAWTPERKAAHAAAKSALTVDDRWRAQLKAALEARWAKRRTNQEPT